MNTRTVTTSKGKTVDVTGCTDSQWDTVCDVVSSGPPRSCKFQGGNVYVTCTFGGRYRVGPNGDDGFTPNRDNRGRN
jgi:hypothetical protein